MAGGRHRGRGRKNNRQRKPKKGPQSPPDERLWRRVTQHFSDEQWSVEWTGASITAWITDKEGLGGQFRANPKAERALLSQVNEALAQGRNEGTYILAAEDKAVRFRTPASIDTLISATGRWKDFFSRHAGKGETPLHGRPPLTAEDASEDDVAMYALLEDVWEAMLRGQPLPEAYALDDQGCTAMQGFDLVKEARKCAARRSGLRFRDDEPAMALLMMMAGRWTTRELLDARLEARRKDGHNPFPRTYDASLVDHADRLGEVNGDEEVAAGRTDLRHLPLVTIDPPDARISTTPFVWWRKTVSEPSGWPSLTWHTTCRPARRWTVRRPPVQPRCTCLTRCFRCCLQNWPTTSVHYEPTSTVWRWSSAWTSTTRTTS